MWLSSFAMYTIARPGLPKFFLLYSALFFHRRSLVVSKKMVIQILLINRNILYVINLICRKLKVMDV